MLCIHRTIRSLACAGRIENLNSEPFESFPPCPGSPGNLTFTVGTGLPFGSTAFGKDRPGLTLPGKNKGGPPKAAHYCDLIG